VSVVAAAVIELEATRVSGSAMVRHVSLADTMTMSSWVECPPLMDVDGDGVAAAVHGDDDEAAAAVLRRLSSSSSSRLTVEEFH